MTTGVRASARGVERVDRSAPYVFVSNHQSIYDIPILFCALPFQLRILAKASLGRFPVLGWHLRYTGHLLVERERTGAATLKHVATMMADGRSLIVFPEGTRSRDGRVGPFKRGLFLMAIEAGLPIVPVSVAGSRHVMRKGGLTTCPGDVEVFVHEPIHTRGMSRTGARSLADRARGIVEREAA